MSISPRNQDLYEISPNAVAGRDEGELARTADQVTDILEMHGESVERDEALKIAGQIIWVAKNDDPAEPIAPQDLLYNLDLEILVYMLEQV